MRTPRRFKYEGITFNRLDQYTDPPMFVETEAEIVKNADVPIELVVHDHPKYPSKYQCSERTTGIYLASGNDVDKDRTVAMAVHYIMMQPKESIKQSVAKGKEWIKKFQ